MKILGHRGARDTAFENTIRSFKSLFELGINFLEFDIHEIKDGSFAIFHDDNLLRTTKVEGLIKDQTKESLHLLKTLEGDHIPLLEEALQLLLDGIHFQIELKNITNFNSLITILKKTKRLNQITIISFNHRWLLEIKNICPEIKTACLLYALPVNAVEIIKAARADGISLNVALVDEALVSECHANNFSVTAWNANDEETFFAMKKLHIDFLATDNPKLCKHLLERPTNLVP